MQSWETVIKSYEKTLIFVHQRIVKLGEQTRQMLNDIKKVDDPHPNEDYNCEETLGNALLFLDEELTNLKKDVSKLLGEVKCNET